MTFPRFKKNILTILVSIPLLLSSPGCIYLVVGGIGAVGGYIVSPDTVEGITEAETELVWDTSIETLSVMGLIEEENKAGGMIVSKVNGARVTITIMALSTSSTKVTVKARKAYLPRISLAQDIFVKIMSRVNE